MKIFDILPAIIYDMRCEEERPNTDGPFRLRRVRGPTKGPSATLPTDKTYTHIMLILIDLSKDDKTGMLPTGNIIPFKAEHKGDEYQQLYDFCQEILTKPLE